MPESQDNALDSAPTLTGKLGPRQRHKQAVDSQETQSTNTMQQDSLHQAPPTLLTARKPGLLHVKNLLDDDRRGSNTSVGYNSLGHHMHTNLALNSSPTLQALSKTHIGLGLTTTRMRRDLLDSLDGNEFLTPTQARARRDSLDSIGTSYGLHANNRDETHSQSHISTESPTEAAQIRKQPKKDESLEVPLKNVTVDRHPSKRRITINTLALNVSQIAEAVNALLDFQGKLPNVSEEELQNLVKHHPGFRVQIYFDEWEAIASTPEELAQKVASEPIHWYHGIAQLTRTAHIRAQRAFRLQYQLSESQEQYNEEHTRCSQLNKEVNDLKANYRELNTLYGDLQDQVEASAHIQQDNNRLRKIRFNDRQHQIQLQEVIDALKAKITTLEQNYGHQLMNPEDFTRHTRPINNCDGHIEPPARVNSRLVNLPAHQTQVSLGARGPVYSNFVKGTKENGVTPKVFDALDKTIDYEWWKDEVIAYLNHNTQVYSTEWKCIEFVRGRTNGLPYTLIKPRASTASTNKYTTLEELFEDLDAEFMPHDQVVAAQTKIASESMKIKYGESFSSFISRFNVVMGLLSYNPDTQKITWLLQNLLPNKQLYRTALDNHQGRTYQSLVLFLRDICSRDLGNRYIHTEKRVAKAGAKEPKASARKTKDDKKMTPKDMRPTKIYNQLVDEKQCLNCGAKGHTMTTPDRPCKGKPRVPDNKLPITVSNCEIENELEFDQTSQTEDEDSGNK